MNRSKPVSPIPSLHIAAPRWSVEVCRDAGGLASVAEEWNELYQRCSAATPFQAHAWLRSWWRWYGVVGRLRLVLVRRDGRLVGAAGLWVRYRWPVTVLAPIGAGVSDYSDVLLDDECAVEAAQALIEALRSEGGWHVLDLPEVRPGAAVEKLYESWQGPRCQTPASTCLELLGGSMEEVLARLRSKSASTARGRLRKIDRVGVDQRTVPAGEVGPAVSRLLRLHAKQWRGRGMSPEHSLPRFERHLAGAAEDMVRQGQAVVVEHHIGEWQVASDLLLVGRDFVGGYLTGVDPDVRSRIDVLLMLVRSAVALAHERRLPVVSMLRGVEEHKLRLRPQWVVSRRLIIARHASVVLAGYAGAVRGRRAAQNAIRDRMPRLRLVLVHTQRLLMLLRSRIDRTGPG